MPYFVFFLDACCLMIVQFQSLPRSISSVDDLHIQLPSLLRCLLSSAVPIARPMGIPMGSPMPMNAMLPRPAPKATPRGTRMQLSPGPSRYCESDSWVPVSVFLSQTQNVSLRFAELFEVFFSEPSVGSIKSMLVLMDCTTSSGAPFRNSDNSF